MKNKLALVIPSMKNSGGMERAISQLANYFSIREDVEVHLIILLKGEIFFPLSNKVIVHQSNLYSSDFNRLSLTIKALLFLQKKIYSIKPTSVLSYGEKYNIFVLFSLFFSDESIFISDRCSPYNPISKFHSILRPFLYRKAKGIICQTEIAKSVLFSKVNHQNIFVIPNAIKIFHKPQMVKKENIIINVGRLVKLKQQDKLIRYFAEINNLNWKLIIVGEGILESQYKNLTKELGVESKVEFVNSTSMIGDLFAKSKIFAFTSNSEGFPNALGEAMLYPIACISYDCIAGPSEMIKDGINGFLVPMNNDNEYKEKLKCLMDSELLRDKFEEEAMKLRPIYSDDYIGSRYLQILLNQ
jgi:GalNAc-alpha-(1->4)-GalNAc-alpha-(1->3)-diNAcBac-PP-undecaprenol alpha-1,4-N-acetyl-D-galactosaminyltransferase